MGFFGSLLGKDASKAANQAAADQYAKEQSAIKGLLSYGDTLPGQYKEIAGQYEPYTEAGTGALERLMAGLGLGGGGEDFTAAYRALPGYESGRATGLQAAERALNAKRGGLDSGAAMKALYRYGSDYEDQRSTDYLNRLAGIAGQGLTATGAKTGLESSGIGANTGIRQTAFGGQIGSAKTVGQGMVAGAQSEQDAIGNLLKTAAYLGGSALGGPIGTAAGKKFFG